MAGDVTVAVVSGQIPAIGGTSDFTKSGFGTPKACIVLVGFDLADNAFVATQSKMSIGFSDFTGQFCITHQDEHNSAKVDCDALKSNTRVYSLLLTDGNKDKDGTASTITDGVRLTGTFGDGTGPFVTVIMFGGADLTVQLKRTVIASSQNSTATITHTGFTDGNDKLIFFIGIDRAQEDSTRTGIVNSFGVCHTTGVGASETIVQRSLGWGSDHNNTEGTPHSEICTDRVLNIIKEDGTADWGLEVTDLEADGDIVVTTRDAGAGASMEVYSLALDLDNRSAKVGSVDSPTGSTFSISGMGFKPQYVGMMLTDLDAESAARAGIETADVQAGVHGISSNAGSGEETCHSWYNEENSASMNTANLFRSRVIDLRDDDTSQTLQDHSHSSFDSGGVTHTVNSEDEDVAKKWGFWAIQEAVAVAAADPLLGGLAMLGVGR